MRFGLGNASGRAASEPHDGDPFTRRYLSGLGALVPHTANTRTTTSGGGGIGVQDLGGGGASGDTSGTAVAPNTPPGPSASYGIGPQGRSSSIFRGGRRVMRYQASEQGARVLAGRGAADYSATSAGSRAVFPTGGLFGLSGLDLNFGGWAKRAFTIPKSPANIARIALAPFTAGISLGLPTRVLTPPRQIDTALRRVIDTSIRPAVRYAGVIPQTLLLPVLPASLQRKLFGLTPSESGIFEKAQQVMLPIDATIVTAGLYKYVTAAQSALPVAEHLTEAGLGPTPDKLSLLPSTTGFVPAGSAPLSLPAGYATPAELGAAAAQSAPAAAPVSLDLAMQTTAPFTPAGAPLSLPPGYATPATIAGNAPLAAPTSLPAPIAGAKTGLTLGKVALDAGKFVGTTAVTTAAQIAVQAALQKAGDAGVGAGAAAPAYATGPLDLGYGAAQPQALPYYGDGGAVGGSGDVPALAGFDTSSMLIVGGIAATAAIALLAGRKKRRKS